MTCGTAEKGVFQGNTDSEIQKYHLSAVALALLLLVSEGPVVSPEPTEISISLLCL